MREEEELDMEVEELGAPEDDVGRHPDTGGTRESGEGIARFAFGALVLAAALALLLVAFGTGYYQVTYANGEQPDPAGEDDAATFRYTVGLYDAQQAVTGPSGDTETEHIDYAEDAPLVGVAMDRLRWTGFIGVGLAGLALVAAVLHRLGALTVPGPAPVMSAFATVFLAAGLIPFVMDVPTYARSQWIPGFLDLVPAFFTSNADGNAVHDVVMRPLLGFWLHALGAAAVPIGAALTFWDQVLNLKAKAQSLAQEAVVD